MGISGRLPACSRVALRLVPNDGVRPDEQAAIDAICGIEDVEDYQRLKPEGSMPTPDWRVSLADGRVADVEVTLAADEAELSFWAQMSEVAIDSETGMKRHSPKRWPDSQLSHEWHVSVSDHNPSDNKSRPVKELMEALTIAVSSVESVEGTSEELFSIANARLVPAWQIIRSAGFIGGAARRAMLEQPDALADGSNFWLVDWARIQGYWYPESLLSPETARNVSVLRPPILVGEGDGALITHPSTTGSSFGWLDPLLSTIQSCVDKKTSKRQMQDAPGEKWLAVMLETSAGWQLADFYDDQSTAPPLSEFNKIKFDYFDEVWSVTKHPHDKSYVVLRLLNGGAEQMIMATPRF